jgi:glycosyltransferase involved in cell wall biosynthesis
MPTFNSAAYVTDSIDSVIAQSFQDWELLIVDDASADGTPELVRERYAHDGRVSVHSHRTNQGAAVARNTAIEAARGRFIAFLDSDDLWRPNKLAVQVPLLESTDACLVYSEYDVFKTPGREVVRTVAAPERLVYRDLLWGDPIGCLTAIYDTEKTGKVLMPDIRMRQDWGLWMRLLRGGRWGLGVQQSLAMLRLHEKSLSANKLRATYFNYKLLRTEGQLGPARAALGVGTHLLGAVGRRLRTP